MKLDINGILGLVPHRYPFLLVDRVLELEPGARIAAIKNVSFNEPFFQGHFPGHPVMPGVLIIEALAQAAAVLEPRVRLAKVNTDNEQALGAQYNIRSIPTLILFKGAREVARQAGAMTTQDIVRWVNSR